MPIKEVIIAATTAVSMLAAGSSLAQSCSTSIDAAHPALNYPVSKQGGQVDDYHGTKVADPYRWLEDGNAGDTHDWVTAQNQLTQSYLGGIDTRGAIRRRLTSLWNYERYSVPFKEGGRYFYSRNDGLQNQAVLYTLRQMNDTPRVLLDPNSLSTDGTVALAGLAVSPDGRYLAYGTAASGSDWNTWRVRDIDSGRDLSDQLEWVKFSGASWSHDGKGFYYSRYDAPNEATKLADANYFQKLYFHVIGTPQSADVLVYDRPDHKDWGFSGTVTDDGQYLIITITQGTERKNRIYYKDLGRADSKVIPLLDEFDAAYDFIDHRGPVLLFRSDRDAPRGRIIAIDLDRPQPAQWQTLVPESADTLQSVSLVDDRLVASYLHDAKSVVRVFAADGKLLREVDLPGIGTAAGFGGRSSDRETFYSYTGFTTPTTIYHYDLASGKSSLYRQPKVDFDPAKFDTTQVFYASRDGTRIPMFIVSRKGMLRDGSNPTYLYGYGGFNISLTPAFSVANLQWVEMGGVLAIPNLRGGGEYGESWHQAGTKLRKQNVFDDFIAAGEWLIANQYTSSSKLAVGGGSNGGLLVGAVVTQRPELFAAALPAVGVMDMLRFQKFTIGWAWTSDYGSSDDAAQFNALYAYSPLHNLKRACYPAMLVTTADHDDRVVPAHSFKFAAAAQAAQMGSAPVLIRIDTKAGHGAGKPTAKQIEEAADRWGFLTRVLDMAPLLPAMAAPPLSAPLIVK